MAERFHMIPGSEPDVTQLLANSSKGDQAALEQLMPLVYGELRRLASAYLRRERSNHTLQSTALVHEAFMRLVHQQDVQWRNRASFYAIAAQMIRRILVDYARSQHAGADRAPSSWRSMKPWPCRRSAPISICSA